MLTKGQIIFSQTKVWAKYLLCKSILKESLACKYEMQIEKS